MESKYKRVNTMGRMSHIDERNRKFTYKELCTTFFCKIAGVIGDFEKISCPKFL